MYRARWRRSLEKPEPLVAGKPDSVNYVLHDVFHTFRKGHRLMVHVQSTWYPLIDRNPQKFVASIYKASAADFVKATQRVYCSAALPSRIVLPVVSPLTSSRAASSR